MTTILQPIASGFQSAAARAEAWSIAIAGGTDLWVGAAGLLVMLVTLWLVIRDAAKGPRTPED
ncbi:MAG: hypothetical protein RIR76_317 [Verrucomicrobiota bacterium]|jgi:hypothetical protein|nr:hypothetical protein [Opitutaceae bacterium]